MYTSALIPFPGSHRSITRPHSAVSAAGERPLKPRRETRPLTLGGCISGVCDACGLERAEGILRFAVNSGILVFPGRRPVEIGPRDPRTDGLPNQHQVTGLIRYFLPDERDRSAAVRRLRVFRAPSAFLRAGGATPSFVALSAEDRMQRHASTAG